MKVNSVLLKINRVNITFKMMEVILLLLCLLQVIEKIVNVRYLNYNFKEKFGFLYCLLFKASQSNAVETSAIEAATTRNYFNANEMSNELRYKIWTIDRRAGRQEISSQEQAVRKFDYRKQFINSMQYNNMKIKILN